MTPSLILRTSTVYLHPLLLVFSVFLLFRGHHEPGGGFVGGLVAATAFCLQVIAYDVRTARRILKIDPRSMIALGLLLAAASGLYAMLWGSSFLTGSWWDINVLGLVTIHLGTPLIFDVGVYHVVLGVTLMLVFSFSEEEGE
jgi:multicomponent Na+:H+ antiporter subunit B